MDIVASPTSLDAPEGSRFPDQPAERKTNHFPSRNVRLDSSRDQDEPTELSKPPLLKHVSVPAYSSPLRHHRRNPSTPHRVKESLDAKSEYVTSQDDGVAEHRINQYTIKQEIGRGSFGAVHLAIDQYGDEYAVKEFSKARLRKRAQSHILRQPLAARRRGGLQGFNSPLHRLGQDARPMETEKENSINLIKQEIAIMKKLNHPNLVRLIEVLDDPSEDSLYMVMEMCKKGVVMRVDLENRADPYSENLCKTWFRDLILGVEYLHAQNVVHRDIKPDNCLITSDEVLKVVDFGVSEMFEKDSEMKTAKSAGSPAFLPPELCVARHGDVSGKAADIWSMGVTLYCLKFGRIPFERDRILDLYESIQTDVPDLGSEDEPHFCDLMRRILEKNPNKRITMRELREHPWVTSGGTDPLLSEEENISVPVEPPTEAEMNAAITGNMRSLMTVVKAVNKFKALTASKRPPVMASILGDKGEARFTQPPGSISNMFDTNRRSLSLNVHNRYPIEGALVAEGIHRDIEPHMQGSDSQAVASLEVPAHRVKAISDPPLPTSADGSDLEDAFSPLEVDAEGNFVDDVKLLPPFRSYAYSADDVGRRGHARDPLEQHLFLRIGPSTFAGTSTQENEGNGYDPDDELLIVSESPGAADVDIYETAYRDEIERILAKAQEDKTDPPQVYLTRRVDAKLMAISGLAGKWMAVGEEAKNQIKDYTHFSARKAKVTEVSRALRQAARQEYERRRQEQKTWIDAAKAEKSKLQESRNDISGSVESPAPQTPESGELKQTFSEDGTQNSPGRWKGKAVDRGRQARSSLLGIVDMVKSKGRLSKAKDDPS